MKIFNQKCAIGSELPRFYAFRRSRHQCLSEICCSSLGLKQKCVVCRSIFQKPNDCYVVSFGNIFITLKLNVFAVN